MKTKILTDFQICISAPLMNLLFRAIPENICCFPKRLKSRLTKQFLSFKTSSRVVCKTYSRFLCNTSLKPFQDVFARRLQDVLEDTKNVRLKM